MPHQLVCTYAHPSVLLIKHLDAIKNSTNDKTQASFDRVASKKMTLRRRQALFGIVVTTYPKFSRSSSTEPVYADVFRSMLPLVHRGLYAMQAKDWVGATEVLRQASSLLEKNAEDFWELRIYVNPPLGACLLALGRIDEALQILWDCELAEKRIARGEGEKRTHEVVSALEFGFTKALLKVEFARQFFDPIRLGGARSMRTFNELLSEPGLGHHESVIPLARAYARKGMPQPLLVLCTEQLAKAQPSILRVDSVPPVANEMRLFVIATSLAAVGRVSDAVTAMNRVLLLNWQRTVWAGTWRPSLDMQLGALGLRRAELSALISMTLRIPEGSRPEASSIIARILESKGLGVRLAEFRRRVLSTSKVPRLVEANRDLSVLEGESAKLKAGPDLLAAYTELQYTVSLVMASVMPDLRSAGIGGVFVPGEHLLKRIPQHWPDAGLIGFLVYSNLAPDSQSLQEQKLLRYCIAGDSLQIADMGSAAEIDMLVWQWRSAVSKENESETRRLGLALREQLLSNLPAEIESRQRWIIDPDGSLNLLSFEALPGEKAPYLLLHEKCISYVTSLAGVNPDDRQATSGSAQVISDPVYEPPKTENGKSTEQTRSPLMNSLAPLHDTKAEAQAVTSSLRRMGILVHNSFGEQANASALAFKTSPKLLHIAAHAVILTSNNPVGTSDDELFEILLPGLGSALVLSGTGGPSLFMAKDLQALPLQNTDLVVLSACDTGNGDIQNNEGVASLRRAIEVAGAKSSVTSLWAVPSKVTTLLMSLFYDYLARDYTAAEALRLAKTDIARTHPSPKAWAGFVLAGLGSRVARKLAPN